jgi:hypothetical protein
MKNQIYEGPGSQSLFLIPVIKPLGTNLKKTLVNYLNFVPAPQKPASGRPNRAPNVPGPTSTDRTFRIPADSGWYAFF